MSDQSDDPGETSGDATVRFDLGSGGAGTPAPDPQSEEVSQSALVGFMSVPVHRRFPVRRSTLLMAVAFLGFGTLLYFNPPEASTGGAVLDTPSGSYFVPGATKTTSPTTTTLPTTTTITRPAAASTTTTTTTRPPTTTTTQPVAGSSSTTSTSSSSSTTTIAPTGSTTTTSTSQTTGTGAGSTTTTAR
jgi:hypothetical protein